MTVVRDIGDQLSTTQKWNVTLTSFECRHVTENSAIRFVVIVVTYPRLCPETDVPSRRRCAAVGARRFGRLSSSSAGVARSSVSRRLGTFRWFLSWDDSVLYDRVSVSLDASLWVISGTILRVRYDTIRYDTIVCITCSKKLTGSQLSPSHGTNKKLKCETKNKPMSVNAR